MSVIERLKAMRNFAHENFWLLFSLYLVVVLTWSRYYEIGTIKEQYHDYVCFKELYAMDRNDTVNYGTIYDPYTATHERIKNQTVLNLGCKIVCENNTGVLP